MPFELDLTFGFRHLKLYTPKIPILMYHEIYRPEERDRLRGLTNPVYNTELNYFRGQMAWLRANNIKTLTIDELVSQKLSPNEQSICLTFDDGWLGNYLMSIRFCESMGSRAPSLLPRSLSANHST